MKMDYRFDDANRERKKDKPEPELNELGLLLKARIDRKRTLLDTVILSCKWGDCISIESAIFTLQLVWVELMGRGLLTK